jgi:hypothetical protein
LLERLSSTLYRGKDEIVSYVEGKLPIQHLFIDYPDALIPANEGPPSLQFLKNVVNMNAPLRYVDPDQDLNDWESFC